ncbi:hypothetical protein AE02_05303 [Klebsiella variicola]|nr:DsbA family protein [Klebsiella variicola]KDL89104.1 hypothetical protein AE02_05303 [Klebsiella variicola]
MKISIVALGVMLVLGVSVTVSADAEEKLVKTEPASAIPANTHSTAPENIVQENSPAAKPQIPSETGRQVGNSTISPLPSHELAAQETTPIRIFTEEQETRIGEVIHEYLLVHPDILVEVSQKLEARQHAQQLAAMTQAVLRHQDALLDDKSTPSYGPADAKVVFIEFFDYQCSVCARQAKVIESLMKQNPQVRFVFKEWPIFSQRWEPSLIAAKKGLQIWLQKGADAYLTYHNALYASGHDEGRLTKADITRAAALTGKLKGNNDEMLEVLSRTDILAQNLGLRGTPGIIVMPVTGATADNLTIIPGGAGKEMLQSAIERAAR